MSTNWIEDHSHGHPDDYPEHQHRGDSGFYYQEHTAALTGELEPEIAYGIGMWALAILKERQGPGGLGTFVSAEGGRIKKEDAYSIDEIFKAIYTVAPGAIMAMLKAGATAYIPSEEVIRRAAWSNPTLEPE